MITLAEPLGASLITGIIVRNIQFENNPQRGTIWADIYLEYGYMQDEVFCAYTPSGQDSSIVKFRFENGCHPARSNFMLGECNACGTWAFRVNGPCEEEECEGAIIPHPTFLEFSTKLSAHCTDPVYMWSTIEMILTSLLYPSLDDMTVIGPLIGGEV